MIDTTYARRIVEDLCRANGQNTDKDAQIAINLRKDIDTAFLGQGCFINELLQNADDRPGTELPAITFWLRSADELVVFHNGRAFNESDVRGICRYGDADNNPKNKDTEQTGYKNIGFKSTFKMAHRVRIWSGEWRFSFNEHDPRWNGDVRYPWQNAPLWLEEKSPILGDQQTVFSFSLREGSKVCQELMNFREHPDNILFLKNINCVAVTILADSCVLTRQVHVNASLENVTIHAKGELFRQWTLCHEPFDMPVEMKNLLSKMGSHVCPEKLWREPKFTISVAYSDRLEHSVNLYAVLPTAMRTGFPFVVNAPFLLNPSRENLLENDWNVFLIRLIADKNFEHVRTGLSTGNFKAIQFLATPQMHGVVPNLETVFQHRMLELLNEPLLPAQFGGHLIKVNVAEIDSTEIYSRFQGAGILLPEEIDFPNIVHRGFNREQLLAKFPRIVQLQLKDILARLPLLLLERSKALDLATSIKVVHVLFGLYGQNMIDTEFLQSLRGLVLYSNHEPFKEYSYRLYLPACFKPPTELEKYFPDLPGLLLNEKYLVGEDIVRLKKFFSAMGVLEECKFFYFSREITIGKVYGAQDVTPYLEYIFQSSSQYDPKNREGLTPKDTVSQLVWFPYLSHLLTSPSYQAFFWQQLQKEAFTITNRYSITSFHAFGGTVGHHSVPLTFLQYMFRNQPLIKDRDGIPRTTTTLYAPSMDTHNMLTRTAQLPVKLSKEMEDHLGLQRIIAVEDCHSFLTSLETEFNYALYAMILKHLLYNLMDMTKRPDILKKKWRFFADDHSWGSTDELKRWAAPLTHPPEDGRKWIDRVDFSDTEFAEFCTFFNIQPIMDHAVKIEDATPNDALKIYLLDKIYDITYLWKRLNGKRAVKDCYESIFVRINQLTFFILENSKYCNGQIFLNNDQCFFASGWKDNKREVAKILGSYLNFSEKEVTALESALSKYPRRFPREEAARFEQFKQEFDIYRQSPHLSHNVAKTKTHDQTTEDVKSTPVTAVVQKGPRRPSTGEQRSAEELKRNLRPEDRPLSEEAIMTLSLEKIPATGNGSRSLMPHDNQPFNRPIDEFSNSALEFSETTDRQNTGGNVNEDQTPQKSASSKPDEENSQGWQRAHSTPEANLISTIHTVPAAVTRANSTPTRTKPSPSKSGSPSSEETLESQLEKKRIGLWAERHVFDSYRIKYEREFQSKAVIVPGKMTVIDPIKPRKIIVIWKNDPLLRPTENKDDELWDSTSPFDLEIIKTIENVVTVKKKEVKGTIGKVVHFFLGSSEWQELIKAKPGNYRIHVVTNIKGNKPGKKCYKDLISEFRTNDELTRSFSYISKTEFTGPAVTVEESSAK